MAGWKTAGKVCVDAGWSMLAFCEAVVSGYVRGRLKEAALEVGFRRCGFLQLLGHDRNCRSRIGLGAASFAPGAAGNDSRIGSPELVRTTGIRPSL